MQCSEFLILESTTRAQEENARCERVTPTVALEGNLCCSSASVKPLRGDTGEEQKLQGAAGDMAPWSSPARAGC